jgi:hypothetical protein
MAQLFGEADTIGEGKDFESGDDTRETNNSYNTYNSHNSHNSHPEPEVDDMRQVRDAALARYVQENERKLELQAKMNARAV